VQQAEELDDQHPPRQVCFTQPLPAILRQHTVVG